MREHNGTVVKTIGDAIMGAFADPADALRCAIRLHNDFAQFNETSGKDPIIIKLGLHVGRCIAVTLNNRLDYYGTAANKAARLESQSAGGDIVISPDLASDPGVRPLLAELSPREEVAQAKGFSEPIRFLRITAEVLATRRTVSPTLPR